MNANNSSSLTSPSPELRKKKDSISKKDFWACIALTAVFCFITGGLVVDALAIHQAKSAQSTPRIDTLNPP